MYIVQFEQYTYYTLTRSYACTYNVYIQYLVSSCKHTVHENIHWELYKAYPCTAKGLSSKFCPVHTYLHEKQNPCTYMNTVKIIVSTITEFLQIGWTRVYTEHYTRASSLYQIRSSTVQCWSVHCTLFSVLGTQAGNSPMWST